MPRSDVYDLSEQSESDPLFGDSHRKRNRVFLIAAVVAVVVGAAIVLAVTLTKKDNDNAAADAVQFAESLDCKPIMSGSV